MLGIKILPDISKCQSRVYTVLFHELPHVACVLLRLAIKLVISMSIYRTRKYSVSPLAHVFVYGCALVVIGNTAVGIDADLELIRSVIYEQVVVACIEVCFRTPVFDLGLEPVFVHHISHDLRLELAALGKILTLASAHAERE